MAHVQTSIDIAAPVQRVEPGEAASSVVSGYAQREAESSLARLKQIAEG